MGTIAFDPFLQAVITVEGRLGNYNRSFDAAIGLAKDVRGGTFNFKTSKGNIPPGWRNMSSTMEVSERPDFGIVSAMYNGFRNPSISLQEQASFVCATGNCTWPLFSSAGVCSSCADVSSGLEASADYGVNGVSVPWGLGESYQGDYTIWSLPTANIRNYNDRFNRTDTERPATLLILNSTSLATKTIAHREHEALLMAFTTIRASEEFLEKDALWNETRPVATECALYLCAQAYQAESVNNALREHIVGSWSAREPWSYAYDYSYYTVPVNKTLAKETADRQGNYLLDRSDLHHDLQLVIPYEGLPNALSMNRRFNVSQAFIISTMTWLDQFVTLDGGESGLGNGPWRGANNVGYPGSRISQQPLIIDTLWNSTNLTLTFDNVARSLTNQIRNSSPQKQDGVLQRWTIHVQVNWWYLVFPIAMLTMGFIYVIMVIVESTRLRLPVWKESARPTLLYGFNGETQRLLREEAPGRKPGTLVRYQIDEKEDCLRLVADREV
jgi:hypothetical protein